MKHLLNFFLFIALLTSSCKTIEPFEKLDNSCSSVIEIFNSDINSAVKSIKFTGLNGTIITYSEVGTGWTQVPNFPNNIAWLVPSSGFPVGSPIAGNFKIWIRNGSGNTVRAEFLDGRGNIVCAKEVRLPCGKKPVKISCGGEERATCGKFSIALHNGVSATTVSKVIITPLPGSQITSAMVGEPDEDGDDEWAQVVGANYSFVEWSHIGSPIPYDATAYLDAEMYIWMNPSVAQNQAVKIEWYNTANVVIASQQITLPCFGDPAILNADTYDWESNTTQLSGANLDLFAGAAPEECTFDAVEKTSSCSNQISYDISCVGNKPTLGFSCQSLIAGESGIYWNLVDPDGNYTVPVTNMPLTKSGTYTLMLTVTHTPVFDYSDPDNPVDVTPVDCDYETTFNVSIPVPVISQPAIKTVQLGTGGCNFSVTIDALQSRNVTATDVYNWTITGPNNFTHSFTGESISYLFVDEGIYTATLTITDDYGCTHTVVRNFTLSYTCQPKFKWGTYEWCKETKDPPAKNINISFTNTSEGGKCPVTYSWDFGDPASGTANTSTLSDPQHMYNSVPGMGKSFTVKLTMTDANNCMKVYTEVIRLEPYEVDFTIKPCPDGKVYFNTANDNPVWTFPGSNSTIKWVAQFLLGTMGWYHNSDPVMQYRTGSYSATLKATSNTTHAWCMVKKQFNVNQVCCEWKVKSHDEETNVIGGKTYRMKMRWKWKVKQVSLIKHTKVKVSTRISKRIGKRYYWYRRALVAGIYAGIQGQYYIKDPNDVCECTQPATQQADKRIWTYRGKSVYRPAFQQIRNLRDQSMKALFGVTINGTNWDVWRYFTPCH